MQAHITTFITIYWYGIGVEKNISEAGKYYRLARANGINLKVDSNTAEFNYSSDNKALTKQIQQALRDLNFYKGKVDGESGPLTRNAIKNFQRFYGYSINTEISQKLLKQLKKSTELKTRTILYSNNMVYYSKYLILTLNNI